MLSSLDVHELFLPPQGKFYADPFVLKYRGLNYLFFEDYDYTKGVISYVILDQGKVVTKPRLALELSTHLSFPYVFLEDDVIYMTPETYRYQSVSLYRAASFPHQWEFERVLVRGDFFSDPILFKYNGYYWLFAAVRKDRLVIYYAQDLHAPFYPHPVNCRFLRGRNAGAPFWVGGHMIRPTMDCRTRYGRAVILKEIVHLTTTEFLEKEIARIEPNWALGLQGTHTFGQNEDYVVYDGERVISPHEDELYSSSD